MHGCYIYIFLHNSCPQSIDWYALALDLEEGRQDSRSLTCPWEGRGDRIRIYGRLNVLSPTVKNTALQQLKTAGHKRIENTKLSHIYDLLLWRSVVR
jgi:hypothetical protein